MMMGAMTGRWRAAFLAAATLVMTGVASGATGSVNYSYDPTGRLTTALYDNGMCVAYSYDQNGNRVSQINSTTSSSATWGTSAWGCFLWSSP
jgi:YD repeat-containing protein